jgi:hypothetical protein
MREEKLKERNLIPGLDLDQEIDITKKVKILKNINGMIIKKAIDNKINIRRNRIEEAIENHILNQDQSQIQDLKIEIEIDLAIKIEKENNSRSILTKSAIKRRLGLI